MKAVHFSAEMRLSAAQCSKLEDATDDELPTTFGQQPSTVNSEEVTIQSKFKVDLLDI